MLARRVKKAVEDNEMKNIDNAEEQIRWDDLIVVTGAGGFIRAQRFAGKSSKRLIVAAV